MKLITFLGVFLLLTLTSFSQEKGKYHDLGKMINGGAHWKPVKGVPGLSQLVDSSDPLITRYSPKVHWKSKYDSLNLILNRTKEEYDSLTRVLLDTSRYLPVSEFYGNNNTHLAILDSIAPDPAKVNASFLNRIPTGYSQFKNSTISIFFIVITSFWIICGFIWISSIRKARRHYKYLAEGEYEKGYDKGYCIAIDNNRHRQNSHKKFTISGKQLSREVSTWDFDSYKYDRRNKKITGITENGIKWTLFDIQLLSIVDRGDPPEDKKV